jgi:serine/threonine protein kinase/WD40 repeat protein
MMDDPMNPAESSSRKTIEQLTEEFMDRLRRGDRPSISEYIRDNATLAAEIRDVFPALAMLERLGSPPADSGQLPVNTPTLEQLGEYRILREVGRGGMGIVYEAVQEPLGRHVALKVLPLHLAGDPVFLERFGREARAAACLHHTNIVPVFDVGQYDGIHFYTMQFIQGQGLDQVIAEIIRLRKEPAAALEPQGNGQSSRRATITPRAAISRQVAHSLLSGRFEQLAAEASAESATENSQRTVVPLDRPVTNVSRQVDNSMDRDGDLHQAGAAMAQGSSVRLPGQAALSDSSSAGQHYYRSIARVGLQVAEALGYMHSQGLLHRDIKPSNLLLDTHGVVWITDLGLAREDESAALTRTGDVVGTVRYMAPERFRGKSAASSDVYSLGMTLYELSALRSAFDESDRGRLIYEIASKDPAPPRTYDPRVPRDLETIVLKAIDREPARRYQSADALADDLRSFIDDRPILARRSGVLERGWRFCRRNRLVASLAASLAALLVVVAVAGSIAALVFRDEANDLQQEQTKSTQRLYDALFARAQSGRWSGRMGQRFESLRALAESANLGPALKWDDEQKLLLRNEAIACLILPDLQLAQPVHRLPQGTFSLAFDANLKRYAASDQNGNLHLCRTADHVELVRLPGAGDRAHVARFSPGDRFLAAKYHDNLPLVARVWDLLAKKVAWESPGGDFDFSPDGSRFALVTPDGAIQLFDLHSQRALKRLPVEPPCEVVRFQPHGDLLAVCSTPSADVRVIDVESGKVVKTFQHPREVLFVNWDPTGKLLACACSDFLGYIWDVESGERQVVLRGHQAELMGAYFSHTGPFLASVSWDQTTRLWDSRTGRPLISADGELLAFSADDRRLAFRGKSGSGADDVRVFEFARGDECRTLQEVERREKGPNHVDISPDNRLLVSCGPDGVWVWDIATGERAAVINDGRKSLGFNSTALFHPNGTSVLTTIDHGIYRWPIKRFREAGRLHVSIGPPQPLSDFRGDGPACLDRDGRTLATIRGEEAYVITLDQASQPVRPAGHAEMPRIAINPNAKSVTRSIWHLDQASQPVRLAGHAGMARIAISPDGKLVATGTWHGLGVVLWDAKAGKKVRDLFPEAASATVAFSPDGKWLVSGANDIFRIWRVGRWDYHDISGAFPNLIAFSDDGETMAVSYSQSAVRLVNPDTGATFAELEPQNPQLMSWLRFSPDGTRLAVACSTHLIQLWDLRRIREQLAAMGLDWSTRPYPPDGADAHVPIKVEVDQGMLGPSHGGS